MVFLCPRTASGKTLIAANLALKLVEVKPVILIDADLDSPNLAQIMGVQDELEVSLEQIEPAHLRSMDMFSMALLAKDHAISMSGSAYVQLLTDILERANWAVDTQNCFVVVDCPAGAADVYRALVKVFAESLVGAIIVTIPNALDDFSRIAKLCNHFGVPVLGVIENMASFICDCGHESFPFGLPKVQQYAQTNGVKFIGRIPLSEEIRLGVEAGNPLIPEVMAKPISYSATLVDIAEPAKVSIAQKFFQKIKKRTRTALAKLFMKAIISSNKQLPLGNMQKDYGLGNRVIELIVMNGKPIYECFLTLRDGKIMAVRHPEKVDTTLILPLDVLLSAARGERDLEESFLLGDIETYGSGAALRAIFFIQKVWGTIQKEAAQTLTPLINEEG